MQDVANVSQAKLRNWFDIPLASRASDGASHNAELRHRRLEFCARLAHEPHDALRFDAPVGRVMIALAPHILDDLFVTRAMDFEKSAMMTFTLSPLAGQGLFTSQNVLWKRQRKLMAPLFTPAIIDKYARAMVDCTARVVDGWKDGEQIDLARETTRIAMSIAGRALFDADTMEESDEIGHALTVALRWASDNSGTWFSILHIIARAQLDRMAEKLGQSGRERTKSAVDRMGARLERPLFYPGKDGKELGEAIRVLDRHVQKMIDLRRADPSLHQDLLSRLLLAKDDDESKTPMTDRQVRDEVLTLFVAGHETTASGLAWTMTHLCEHPEFYARVKNEALAVGENPGASDYAKLPFTLRAFKEALRLEPPVYIYGRTAKRDTVIGDIPIKKWTNVLVSSYSTHRRIQEWQNPDAFIPDRFLPENEAKRPKHSWFPFGAGPRVCIGNHFALLEASLVLAVMFSKCDFELVSKVIPDPSATLRAKSVPMVVRKRKAN